MPCFRGLDMSISVQPQSERLPEFPHPDASSVRVSLSSSPSFNDSKRSSISTLDSGRLQKANPRISVYVPSIAGRLPYVALAYTPADRERDSQFMINYSVLRAPEPSYQLFFKLLINGRRITSWGINPVHEPVGTVSRALYEPCERWHYNEGSTTLKADGIEARSFFFSPCSPSSSIADDGGVIEVHVYRAQGKRRRAMTLEKFRRQDYYGVLSPSNGLLECPEATAYFDWELIDSKTTPFATFQFHYRDWSILQQLSLIPTEATTRAESYPLPHTWQGTESGLEACSMPNRPRNTPVSSCSGYQPASRAVSDPTESSSADEQVVDMAFTKVPLPRKSTDSLATSKAPSVAPSLLSYVEDSSDESSAELGTAVGVQLRVNKTSIMAGHRPLPQIPRSQYVQAGSTASGLPWHDGLSSPVPWAKRELSDPSQLPRLEGESRKDDGLVSAVGNGSQIDKSNPGDMIVDEDAFF